MKKLELKLIKTENGITATDFEGGKIHYFDETDEARQQFVKFIVDEFINREVDNGRKYK